MGGIMISCIILAGGKGSRMEYKNKALLKKNGEIGRAHV